MNDATHPILIDPDAYYHAGAIPWRWTCRYRRWTAPADAGSYAAACLRVELFSTAPLDWHGADRVCR